ncbi:MAG TPA: hypothetical protein VGO47_06865 [Chlamydiales bacterium]|nr:hypothetical protein [Chlamydiales bacterium]
MSKTAFKACDFGSVSMGNIKETFVKFATRGSISQEKHVRDCSSEQISTENFDRELAEWPTTEGVSFSSMLLTHPTSGTHGHNTLISKSLPRNDAGRMTLRG